MFITGLLSARWRVSPLLRYGLVGLLTNLVTYGGYLALTVFNIAPKVAMTVTYLAGASIGFVSNKNWTFAHDGNATTAALRFITAHACGYLLNYFNLWVFVDRLGYPHQFIQGVSIMLVAGFLFLVFKFWVFRNSGEIRQ